MSDIPFRYFQSVFGHVVPRFGTSAFIGVRRHKDLGWEWFEDISRIPESEVNSFLREYNRVLKDGALVEVKRADYEAQQSIEEPAAPKPKRSKRGTNEEG